MSVKKVNKRKIFNDPVFGFITIPNEVVFDVIEHPYFQRLRRIKQLGLTHLVYPGALHTRFHHSLGAMHLMGKALFELRLKGNDISDEEMLGAQIAILLHDVGHGPYSHALEHAIVTSLHHEEISVLFMKRLNDHFKGALDLALSIFENRYPRKFFYKLVSSQFDMDRLDYLKRDSFFTGVSEGVINYERLLNMIEVAHDEPVIEAKGIYSVEKFITARRLMYWQVYLHKTVLAAEYMITRVLKRAKELSLNGEKLFATPALSFFLNNTISKEDFETNPEVLFHFSNLDDYDIFSALKVWVNHDDLVLSELSKALVFRRLFKIEMGNNPIDKSYFDKLRQLTMDKYHLKEDEVDYFCFIDHTSNYTYQPGSDRINILFKDGSVQDIAEVSDQLNITLMDKPTTKYFVCYPKGLL
ncbi:MAG: phosphohydrolase [Bacteroidetes bacterium]|nr:MAG: phosphohydrolase [Bacteroidota bacterium]